MASRADSRPAAAAKVAAIPGSVARAKSDTLRFILRESARNAANSRNGKAPPGGVSRLRRHRKTARPNERRPNAIQTT